MQLDISNFWSGMIRPASLQKIQEEQGGSKCPPTSFQMLDPQFPHNRFPSMSWLARCIKALALAMSQCKEYLEVSDVIIIIPRRCYCFSTISKTYKLGFHSAQLQHPNHYPKFRTSAIQFIVLVVNHRTLYRNSSAQNHQNIVIFGTQPVSTPILVPLSKIPTNSFRNYETHQHGVQGIKNREGSG